MSSGAENIARPGSPRAVVSEPSNETSYDVSRALLSVALSVAAVAEAGAAAEAGVVGVAAVGAAVVGVGGVLGLAVIGVGAVATVVSKAAGGESVELPSWIGSPFGLVAAAAAGSVGGSAAAINEAGQTAELIEMLFELKPSGSGSLVIKAGEAFNAGLDLGEYVSQHVQPVGSNPSGGPSSPGGHLPGGNSSDNGPSGGWGGSDSDHQWHGGEAPPAPPSDGVQPPFEDSNQSVMTIEGVICGLQYVDFADS